MSHRPPTLVMTLFLGLAVAACGGGDEDAATSTTTQPASAPASSDVAEILEENDLVYLTDDEVTWTLDVASPTANGPWPLVVGSPHSFQAPESLNVSPSVVPSWFTPTLGRPLQPGTDANLHLHDEMNRAACIVSWAQAHAGDYGADPETTTVVGFSGGAMAATWVGLGVADDSECDEPIAHLPVALVAGESQFLFHHERWDPAFASGDPEPRETLDGLLDPQRWNTSSELRVGLWSATNPIAETRSIENPPAPDSWIRLRDAATPDVDDLAAVGAFDDERIDWHDKMLLMEQRAAVATLPGDLVVVPIHDASIGAATIRLHHSGRSGLAITQNPETATAAVSPMKLPVDRSLGT